STIVVYLQSASCVAAVDLIAIASICSAAFTPCDLQSALLDSDRQVKQVPPSPRGDGLAQSPLFREHRPGGHGRRSCRGLNHERRPGIPARWPIFIGELAVGLQVEIALPFV